MTPPATIFYVRTGVANMIRGNIYLHENLLKPENKEYHDYLLNHEEIHAKNETGEIADAFTDIKISRRFFFKNIRFILETPGAWWQLLPVRVIKGACLKESILAVDSATSFGWLVLVAFLWAIL